MDLNIQDSSVSTVTGYRMDDGYPILRGLRLMKSLLV
jgi:hypothetical protein